MLSYFAVITVLLLRTRKKCGVYRGAYKSTTQQQHETTAEVHVCKLPSTHAYKFDVQLSVSLQLFHSIGRANQRGAKDPRLASSTYVVYGTWVLYS